MSNEDSFSGCDPSTFLLSRASWRQFESFLKRSSVELTRTRAFFTDKEEEEDVTRLDTHNQPAVIEAFNAWPRTLTRSYARVPRCRILTLSVNLFSTRRVNERRARTAENTVVSV